MYDVSITNNYMYGLRVDVAGAPPPPPGGGYQPVQPGGGKAEYKGWGGGTIDVFGMGQILFLDLGNRKLDGYTNPKLPWTQMTWGGLVRYRGLDAYLRYEGAGKVDLVVDEVGSIGLHFSHGGMVIDVPDVTVT